MNAVRSIVAGVLCLATGMAGADEVSPSLIPNGSFEGGDTTALHATYKHASFASLPGGWKGKSCGWAQNGTWYGINAKDGSAAAYMQNVSSISNVFVAPYCGEYRVSYWATARSSSMKNLAITTLIDDQVIIAETKIGDASKWIEMTANVSLTVGSHVFAITGVNRDSGDQDVAIDLVSITAIRPTVGVTVVAQTHADVLAADGFEPFLGIHSELTGNQTFTAPADELTTADGLTKGKVTGWKLKKMHEDGSVVVTSGEGTSCTIEILADEYVELEWQMSTQYKVTATATEGGKVEPSEAWVAEGEDVTVTFTPDATHGFYKWAGDVAAALEKTNPLTFTVDGPKTIEAHSMVVAKVTTGEELIAAVAAASATDPSVIEIAEGDIFLTATLNLTKPITVRGAGIGKTVIKRDATVSSLRMLELSNASALVENLTVTNGYLNSGTGAGAYVSAGTIRRCEFYNCHNQHWNTGWNQGGGVKLSGSNSKLIACVIRGVNVGDGQGEALWLESSAVAESCLICDNTCTTTGRADAYMVKVASATLRGCTIVNNYMGNSVALYNSSGTVKDCIVFGNKGDVATSGGLGNGFDIAGSTGSSSVINTLVTDPGFVDFANKNYALTAGPAIDAALSGEATLVLTTVDAAGNPRKTGKAVDIGALECVQSEPACSFIAKKTTVLENDPAILTLYAIGVGDTPEYTISFGDETAAVVTTDTTVEHAYAHSGVYTVTVSVPGVTPKTGTITVKPKNLYVKEGGTGAAPYASEDQAAGYIEDALAEAGDGCTIWLKKGNYTLKTKTPIEVKKSVTIRGATGRPEDVIVTRMSGGSRPFTLGHASAVLADLTVTGGTPPAQNNHGCNVRITTTGGIVTNCIIRNGSNGHATTGGGGLAMAAGLVTHCVISNNYAYERGTGVFIEGGRLENCLICGNYGGEDKGHHDDSGTVCVNGSCSIINCTIADNRAERCPSIYFMGGSNQKVINCLLFGNKSTAMTDSTIGVYYPSGKASLFTACAAPFKINDTCFTADDLKINAEYRPMAKSICRDNATTSGITVPGTDLAGNPRQDEETGKLDIGCYEFHSSGLTASISSSPAMRDGAASGLTPYPITFTAEADGGEVTAYRWFVNGVEQTAETTATFVTNLTVAGTYQVTLKVSDGNQDYDADNTITVKTYPPILYVDKNSTNPVAPYETEATAATFLEDALAAATDNCEIRIAPETYPARSGEITIGKGVTIRGMGSTPADVVLDRKDANTAHRILTISHESSLVTGLTVSGGRRTTQGQYGGGVMITGRGGTISNCVVRNCGANGSDAGGGGIMLDVDNALVTHCVVTNCTSANDAPGNYAYVGGNGVCLWKGTVRDSLIAFCRQNNDSHGRKETWPDGAVAIYGGKMINCTVASNVNATCSGIRAHGGKLINTIVSCNRLTTQDAAVTAKVLVYGKAKTTTCEHCLADLDVDGKFAVEDPAQTFLRPGNGNFRLRAGSKAIDAGDASAVTSTVDLRGNPRILCGAVDLGCYEKKIGMTVLIR